MTELSKKFLNHCLFEKRLSKKTIKAYQIDLHQFEDFILSKHEKSNLSDVSRENIREYLEKISSLKPKSIKRKLATLKSFYSFLEYEDILLVSPFRKLKLKIREPKLLPKVLIYEEMNSLFELVYKSFFAVEESNKYAYFEALRNIVVIELLFATGARVSEIANLKQSDLNILTGEVLITGKGSKERLIQICNMECIDVVKKYLIYLETFKCKSEYLLINRSKRKLSDQSIRTIVKSFCVKAQISKHVTPHMFRHTLATLLLENDVDIKYIQSILGHSSISTTQIYTHVSMTKQRQIFELKHPREHLKYKMNNG